MLSFDEIEARAARLGQALWHEREQPFEAADPIALLNPENAAALLGIDVEYVDRNVLASTHGGRIVGIFDRSISRIVLATQVSAAEARFTAAHELGHAVLHKTEEPVFRDHAAVGDRIQHSRIEAEANRFAAAHLMPKHLLRRQFTATFGISPPFVFDDDVAFQLCGDDPRALLVDEQDLINRGFALTRARSFNGRHVVSLHEQFRVSPHAMARRLVETGLVGNNEQFERVYASRKSPSGSQPPLFGTGEHLIDEDRLEAIFVVPFKHSSSRAHLTASLRALIGFVRQIGITCDVWIDGSYATRKREPSDIDVTIFINPGQIERLSDERYAELQLLLDRGLMLERYACDVFVERANDEKRKRYFRELFGQHGRVAKGIPFLRIID
jgi:Zn-dependent peptidase ImmA (M78 family)